MLRDLAVDSLHILDVLAILVVWIVLLLRGLCMPLVGACARLDCGSAARLGRLEPLGHLDRLGGLCFEAAYVCPVL